MAIKRLDHVNFITHDMPATIDFYCNVIGLVHGNNLSIDTAQSVYFYIKGQNFPILHVGNAKKSKKQPRFERLADLPENHSGDFATGPLDHFCLLLEESDYQPMIDKLESLNIKYQTFSHPNVDLKQIWVLDPNGIRVELSFARDEKP